MDFLPPIIPLSPSVLHSLLLQEGEGLRYVKNNHAFLTNRTKLLP